MKPDNILKASLLDILFENKNKAYGAYPLRKYYNERLYKSLLSMFLTAIALALSVILTKVEGRMAVPVKDIWMVDVFTPPTYQQQPEDAIKKPIVSRALAALQKPMDAAKIEPPAFSGNNATAADVGFKGDPSPPLTAALALTEVEKPIDKNIPLNTAEIMPSFPGGVEALRKFLERNLNNPKDIEQGQSIAVKI